MSAPALSEPVAEQFVEAPEGRFALEVRFRQPSKRINATPLTIGMVPQFSQHRVNCELETFAGDLPIAAAGLSFEGSRQV
jgi:hypothetical protein